MDSSDTKRNPHNIRMTDALHKKIKKFAKDNSTNISGAVDELIQLGLDANLCGVESSISQSKKISRSLDMISSLLRESIKSSDTACALTFYSQIQRGLVTVDQFSKIFPLAQKLADKEIAKLKKPS